MMKILAEIQRNPESLTERVYRELREEIISGNIPGGTTLVESTLAAEMNVSKTPVREALQKIALEGLLNPIPRVGYIVKEMSDRDIRDLFIARMAIEKLAARWAIKKLTPHEFEQLEMNLKKSDEAIKNGLPRKMAELDKAFHGIINRACRNKTLYQICQNLRDHALRCGIAIIHQPDVAKRTRDEHLQIYKALRSGDPVKVEQAIDRHLRQVMEDIIRLLEQSYHESFV